MRKYRHLRRAILPYIALRLSIIALTVTCALIFFPLIIIALIQCLAQFIADSLEALSRVTHELPPLPLIRKHVRRIDTRKYHFVRRARRFVQRNKLND
jgi:hypothetical protein